MNLKVSCKNFKELYQQFFEHGIGSYASNGLIIVNAKNKRTISINPIGEVVIAQGYKHRYDNGLIDHAMIICEVVKDKIASLDVIDLSDNELQLNQWI